jgi:hypothetical protein
MRLLRMGTIAAPGAAPRNDRALHAARLKEARRRFEEIAPEERLRPRGRLGWLVDSETDYLYAPARGEIFEHGSAKLIADQAALWFYLDRDGVPVVLERLPDKWCDLVAAQARRSAR